MLAIQTKREAMAPNFSNVGHKIPLYCRHLVLDSLSDSKGSIATHYYPTIQGWSSGLIRWT